MAPILEEKLIGSDQKTVLKEELLIWRTENEAMDSRIQFASNSPNWFLGNCTLDPHLEWA
jgi:hypothetical protein